MTKTATFILRVVILATLLVVAFYHGRRTAPPAIVERCDTLCYFDTIKKLTPVYITKRVRDTILVPVPADTVTLHDSIFFALPREERVYADSSYYAVVSGFRPSLDTLIIHQPAMIITRTEAAEPSRLSLGLTIGPSVIVAGDSRILAGFGVTAGLHFRF